MFSCYRFDLGTRNSIALLFTLVSGVTNSWDLIITRGWLGIGFNEDKFGEGFQVGTYIFQVKVTSLPI